jgi:hypothetical protein
MVDVNISGDVVTIGARFAISFQRTLRVPDDGRSYPLPPGLGALPIHAVADFSERVPAGWREGDIFIPLFQREALWLAFAGAAWKPNAVKVGVGGVNAISGEAWDDRLRSDPQDYLVCPDQPWLDGINSGTGRVRQFVAMPLGLGDTVEGQLTGTEEVGGIQLLVYEPKPGRFPDGLPAGAGAAGRDGAARLAEPVPAMGIGAGGEIRQKIYPDRYGIDVWDPTSPAEVVVHIINTGQYRELTGENPPPTPITAQSYVEFGLPWFELYDEGRGDIAPAARLAQVKAIAERDEERGVRSQVEEASINIDRVPVLKLRPGGPRGTSGPPDASS